MTYNNEEASLLTVTNSHIKLALHDMTKHLELNQNYHPCVYLTWSTNLSENAYKLTYTVFIIQEYQYPQLIG